MFFGGRRAVGKRATRLGQTSRRPGAPALRTGVSRRSRSPSAASARTRAGRARASPRGSPASPRASPRPALVLRGRPGRPVLDPARRRSANPVGSARASRLEVERLSAAPRRGSSDPPGVGPGVALGRRPSSRPSSGGEVVTRRVGSGRGASAPARSAGVGSAVGRRAAAAGRRPARRPKASASFARAPPRRRPGGASARGALGSRHRVFPSPGRLQNVRYADWRAQPGLRRPRLPIIGRPGAIAQFGRAPGSHPGGRRFEPG